MHSLIIVRHISDVSPTMRLHQSMTNMRVMEEEYDWMLQRRIRCLTIKLLLV